MPPAASKGGARAYPRKKHGVSWRKATTLAPRTGRPSDHLAAWPRLLPECCSAWSLGRSQGMTRGSGIGACAIFLTTTAHAQTPKAEAVQLAWEAPAECPSGADVLSETRRLLGGDEAL